MGEAEDVEAPPDLQVQGFEEAAEQEGGAPRQLHAVRMGAVALGLAVSTGLRLSPPDVCIGARFSGYARGFWDRGTVAVRAPNYPTPYHFLHMPIAFILLTFS